jgi:hypothetical protein
VTETLSLIVAVVLAVVHVIAGKLRFLDGTPRTIWLSAAGGVSVAYVFVHILPELAEAQDKFREHNTGWLAQVELHSWLLALTGLAIFYGLERLVKQHQMRTPHEREGAAAGVFWIHTASFAVYNLLFGYLLPHREGAGVLSLSFYGVAIAFHFLVNDFGLRQDHKDRYDGIVRWVLAAALLGGYIVGRVATLPELGTSAVFALLAGGIVLNVLKEELPAERQSRFSAFAGAAAGYAALLILA